MVDVIVAGSGPAGASAAYFLSQAGFKVVVLEKQKLPRYKACGGGVSLPFIQKTFPFSVEPVIETRAEALNYQFLGLSVDTPVRKNVLALVMRDRFDSFLLSQANCEVRDGFPVVQVSEYPDRVRVTCSRGEVLEAGYLLGADGANSTVARSAGLWHKRTIIPALEGEVEVSPDIFSRHAGRPGFIFGPPYGYLWIFPKAGHLSVGIAMRKPKPGELQDRLRRKMSSLGINLDGVQLHGHPLPVDVPGQGRRLMTGRILLAGDAAALVDPFSGEGIRNAIKSGKLAAQAIISGQVERYSKLIHSQIVRENRKSFLVAQVFYSLWPLCLVLGSSNPFASQTLLDLLSDRCDALDVFFRSLLSLPVYITVEMMAGIIELMKGQQRAESFRRDVFSLEG